MAVNAGDPQLLLQGATLRIRQGNMDAATALLQRGLAMRPDHPDLLKRMRYIAAVAHPRDDGLTIA